MDKLVSTRTNLARYEKACRAIADAKAVDEVKEIINQSEAMRAYAKQAKNRTLEADAWEIRYRAETRLGELIIAQKETVGLAKGGQPYQRKPTGNGKEPVATLAQAGIDKKLSSRAQKLAKIPKTKREKIVVEGRERIEKEHDRVVSTLLKEGAIADARKVYDARKEKGSTVEHLTALAASGKKFAVIYADPPWEFEVYSGKGKQRSAERHYDVQSIEDIKAWPVLPLAADDCALFMWCVMPELPGALDVIAAWGFKYKTAAFVWVKQNPSGEGLHTGMGYWTRANAEMCLLATRGSPLRLAKDVHQIIMAPVAEHSVKPEEARRRIERLLAGSYLELFARRTVPGWTVWGNEVLAEAAE